MFSPPPMASSSTVWLIKRTLEHCDNETQSSRSNKSGDHHIGYFITGSKALKALILFNFVSTRACKNISSLSRKSLESFFIVRERVWWIRSATWPTITRQTVCLKMFLLTKRKISTTSLRMTKGKHFFRNAQSEKHSP